jgi:hypothetical protein
LGSLIGRAPRRRRSCRPVARRRGVAFGWSLGRGRRPLLRAALAAPRRAPSVAQSRWRSRPARPCECMGAAAPEEPVELRRAVSAGGGLIVIVRLRTGGRRPFRGMDRSGRAVAGPQIAAHRVGLGLRSEIRGVHRPNPSQLRERCSERSSERAGKGISSPARCWWARIAAVSPSATGWRPRTCAAPARPPPRCGAWRDRPLRPFCGARAACPPRRP